MPIFRVNRAFGVGRSAKVFLYLQGGLTRGVVPDLKRQEKQAQELRKAREQQRKMREELQKEQRRGQVQRKELREQKLEIFQLRSARKAADKLRDNAQNASSAHQESGNLDAGALPDFAIIGAQKCGTTAFYQLLAKHPDVKRAAVREVHFFDRSDRFDKGTEWYRTCFPPPRWKNGRRSITGEKTPSYLFHPHVAERMAEVIPRVRLVVLLRNPVDRAYSHYHHQRRREGRPPTFEAAIEEEMAWQLHKGSKPSVHEGRAGVGHGRSTNLLARGFYVDQLQRWSRFFDGEQMLVLKSEDFFKQAIKTMELVQDFLGLQYQELALPPPKTSGGYEPMDPATRQRLEAYFEPYNQRLYEYLGVDFGW